MATSKTFNNASSSVWTGAVAFICVCLHNSFTVWWRMQWRNCFSRDTWTPVCGAFSLVFWGNLAQSLWRSTIHKCSQQWSSSRTVARSQHVRPTQANTWMTVHWMHLLHNTSGRSTFFGGYLSTAAGPESTSMLSTDTNCLHLTPDPQHRLLLTHQLKVVLTQQRLR